MAAAPQKPGVPQPSGTPTPVGNAAAQAPRSPEAMVAAAAATAREMSSPETVAPAGEANDEQLAAAWGFTEKRRRLSREATIGLVAVLALVGLFGYVAWKKWKGRAAPTVVAKSDPAVKTIDPFDESTEVSNTKFNDEPPTDKTKDEFSLSLEDDLSTEPSPSKPKSRVITDDPLDVSDNQAEPTMNDLSMDEEDPFDQPAKKTATLDLDESEEPPKPQEPARLPQSDLLADDFEEPVRVPVTPKPQKTQKPARLPEVDQFAENTTSNLDEPSPTTDLPPTGNVTRHPLLREHEYLVVSGDNFCVISKKMYGTGRYFLALQEANRNRVADPCRMKPGLIVSVPPQETLERQFSELIPQTRQATGDENDKEKADAPRGAKRPTATAQAPGLFRDDEGQLWYRVGEGDTLSEIAQNHLGRQSRADQIINKNRDLLPDPNKLKIGQILRMPNDASPVRLVETDREIR